MSGQVNIGGVWKDIAGVYVNIGGVWKTAESIKCNIGGVWKDGWSSGGTTIDHSTPVQVVNAAYDTSGNGGRKLVRLSNGNLIEVARDSTKYYIFLSTDNGATWTNSYTPSAFTTLQDVSLATDGTYVYVLHAANNNIVFCRKLTNVGVNLGSPVVVAVDSSQTALGSCSIACDSSGNIYAAWASKNSTYPDSFNVRHAKSTDGATWTKADGTAGIDQLSAANTSGTDFTNPCIISMSNGYPQVFYRLVSGTTYYIEGRRWNGSSWLSATTVYQVSTYAQSSPCAVVSPDGTIHVTWYGLDSTDYSTINIRYSKSADNGVIWSAMEKLTSGNSYAQAYPSVAADKDNKIYVVWHGIDAAVSATYTNIRKIIYNGSWGSVTTLTSSTTAIIRYPSTCANYTDFTDPLCIYQDTQAGDIKFRGIWTES